MVKFQILTNVHIVNYHTLEVEYDTTELVRRKWRRKEMPKPGYSTVTISNLVYNKLLSAYKRRQNDLILQGISSFSGFLTNVIYKATIQNTRTRNTKKKSIRRKKR